MNNNPLGNKIVSVIIILFFWALGIFFLDLRGRILSYSASDYIGWLFLIIGILLAIVNWRNNLFKLKR